MTTQKTGSDLLAEVLASADTAPIKAKKTSGRKAKVSDVVLGDKEGEITLNLPERYSPEDDELKTIIFDRIGVSPADWEIDGAIRLSTWTMPNGDDGVSYRARVIKKIVRDFEYTQLMDIFRDAPELPTGTPTGKGWLTLQIGDIHIGKSEEDGGGTPLILSRVRTSVATALKDADQYEGVHIPFLGDLIEGFVSQGGQNINGTDLGLSEQIETAVSLCTDIILQALRVSPQVITSFVPGNHGEVTRQQNVLGTDNYDILVGRNVETFLKKASQEWGLDVMDRITFHFPEKAELSVTYPVGGVHFTSVHGHKIGKGTALIAKAESWWQQNAFHGGHAARSGILMLGHYHSFFQGALSENRFVVMSPALETNSQWLSHSTSSMGHPGIAVYTTNPAVRHGAPQRMTVV